MSRKNIRGQGLHIISSHFTENVDKHAYKKEYGHHIAPIVFGIKERDNLCDVWVNFSNFMKGYDNSIQYVKDLDKDHFQAFLDYRAETCDKNTLEAYKHALYKIELLANDTYSACNLDYAKHCTIPADCKVNAGKKGVDAVMTRSDYNKLLEYSSNSNSQSAYVVRLQEAIANRVAGAVNARYDKYDPVTGTIDIKGKGGKWHTVQLSEDGKKLVEEIHSKNFNKQDPDKLFSIKPDSVNKYLARTEQELGLNANSFHAIRRLKAQEFYDDCRNSGMSIQQSVDATSKYLSHGENRNYMMTKSYIKIW